MSDNPRRTLVTGAAGFIGSHVAERLAASGHEVVGLDCFTDHYDVSLKAANAAAAAAAGVRMLRCDLRADDLSGAVDGVDHIVHLAARPGLGSDDLTSYSLDNEHATTRLITAVRASPGRSRLRLFVNIATSSVYGRFATGDERAVPRPISAYGRSKLAAERAVMALAQDGLPVCSLRPFSVFGPRERPEKLVPKLLHAAFSGTPFTLFEGSEHHRRSYTYVGDVADAIVAALDNAAAAENQIFNIGAPWSHTTAQLIELVGLVTGRTIPCRVGPARAGDLQETRAVGDKAKALLGFAAATDLEEGIRLHADWMMAMGMAAGV